jgi:hypothetical protein
MEKNDFLEKIKKNWKKILIIGGISYVALTLISTAVGAAFITKRGKQIENCEDEIGREFQARKSEFQERFNKNWNDGIDKLVKGFDESQKKREQHALKLGESLLEDAKRRLKGNIWKIAPALKVELEKEIAQLEKDTRIEQAAFKRKWFSQCDSETTEQYERRKAEGSIDWQSLLVKRREERLEEITNELDFEEKKESLVLEKNYLQSLQDNFQKKYGEPYQGKEFKKLCTILQDQAKKETQEFLASVAEAEAVASKKDELVTLMHKRDKLVEKERRTQKYLQKKPLLRIQELQNMITLYTEYSDAVAAFEAKWGMEAEAPLKELKAELDSEKDPWRKVDWGDSLGNVLAKVEDLKTNIPKIEKEFEAQVIVGVKKRLTEHENEIRKKQEEIKRLSNSFGNHDRWLTLGKEVEIEEAELQKIETFLSSMERAFAKKWDSQKENETLDQLEKRKAEGNIQFLSLLTEHFEREEKKMLCKMDRWEEKNRAKQLLSQSQKDFFGTYGTHCLEDNSIQIANN